MEENQHNTEERIHVENGNYSTCKRHPFLKCLLCALLTFLAAFCAFYTVMDWHMKSLFPPEVRPFGPRFERAFQKDMSRMNRRLKDDERFAREAANVIHLEQTKDYYKILIDLRAFDNNANNVQVTSNGNILTIHGRSIKKSKHNEQISEFQQNYMFGENVKLKDLTKETEGHYYVVTIPIGDSEE